MMGEFVDECPREFGGPDETHIAEYLIGRYPSPLSGFWKSKRGSPDILFKLFV
jgi:hypothetical protein